MKQAVWLGLAALATQPAFAAETQIQSDPVLVTADRFPETEPTLPASVSVITREDIAQLPALDIPDILKTRAGIQVNALYGSEGIDAPIDMRGFGETGSSNSLILLDGQRLNPVDMSSQQWATIPLQAIERIEIIHGGGSVLYGDRASGGVINLITDKSGTPHTSLTGTLGSYGYRSLDGFVAGGAGGGYYNAFLHSSSSDGWRQNTESEQLTLSGRGGLNWADNETFVDYAVYRQDYGMPASIDSRTYHNDPKRARTPFDNNEKEGYRLRPGIALQLSDALQLNAEFAVAGERQQGDNVSFGSTSDRSLRTLSFTPRVRWQHGLGTLDSATTAGLDYYHGRVSSDSSTFASQFARQVSRAAYLQNTTRFDTHWSMTLGLRSQNMQQHAEQDAYAPWFMPAFSGSSDRTRSVYELGFKYLADQWSGYLRSGTSFRFATTDELFGFDPFTGNPVFAGDLKPQRARNLEIGGDFHLGPASGRLALYRMNVEDEIGFDSNVFANVNFDPTRRRGLEAELGWQFDHGWRAALNYARTSARFRDGVYDGNRVPLVARDKATLQLGWDGGRYGDYSALVNYVGSRHVSGDYTNEREKLPGYTTLDLRAQWDFKPLQLTLTALNLTDKRYAPYGLYSTFRSDYFYFPADGRTLFLSARYDFR